MNWISAGKHAGKFDAFVVKDFADRQHAEIGLPSRDHCGRARAARCDLDVDLSAMPSRGNSSFTSQMPEVLAGTATSPAP